MDAEDDVNVQFVIAVFADMAAQDRLTHSAIDLGHDEVWRALRTIIQDDKQPAGVRVLAGIRMMDQFAKQ